MSAEARSTFSRNNDAWLKDALIRRGALSDDVVARITNAQRKLGVGFVDAAVKLGIVTQAVVEAIRNIEPTIVAVPRRLVDPGNNLPLLRDPFDAHAETLRSLRTELLLRRDGGGGGGADILAVVSPCAGEGRSQLAAELAIAFSQLGQPTLLVDADLRHPRQHLLFGADNSRGLSDAITIDAEPFLHPVEGCPNLSLLTSGLTPPNPLELLCDGRLENLIEGWRRSFSYLVFDTAPLEKYSDGLAVATLVGRVLTVCRAAHTPFAASRSMLRRLAATHSRILGAVVNHF